MTEPALTDMTRIVEGIVGDLTQLGRSDLLLFGHCFGALVAYEVARALGPAVADYRYRPGPSRDVPVTVFSGPGTAVDDAEQGGNGA